MQLGVRGMLVVFLVCSVDFVWWWFVVVLYGYAWMVEPVSVVVVCSSLRRDCFSRGVKSEMEEAVGEMGSVFSVCPVFLVFL
jgi:hypothetical protein